MSDLTLYTIDKDFSDWELAVEKNEGEITPELEDWFNQIIGDGEHKIKGVGKYYLNESSSIDSIDVEVSRLQAIKKYKVNRLAKIKEMTLAVMQKLDISKVDFGIFKVSIAKNPPSCDIVNEEEIPAEYLTTIPESYQPDKARIKKDLIAGKEVKGAKLITDKVNLRVK